MALREREREKRRLTYRVCLNEAKARFCIGLIILCGWICNCKGISVVFEYSHLKTLSKFHVETYLGTSTTKPSD